MHLNGRILAVQEGRFRLLTDAGQVYLLTLAHDARLGGRTLEQYLAERTRLTVDFKGEANLVSGVARSVQPESR